MTEPAEHPRFAVVVLPKVEKAVGRIPAIANLWTTMKEDLAASPYAGPKRTHLTAELECNYRYRLAGYRAMYEVDAARRVVGVYDFGPRGDFYKGKEKKRR